MSEYTLVDGAPPVDDYVRLRVLAGLTPRRADQATAALATGRTAHSIGSRDGVRIAAQPVGTVSYVEIVDGAFYLLYFDHDGRGITDTWHLSVEAAKQQANFEFLITDADWSEKP